MPNMSKEQQITQWINSGEYRTEIDAALTKILRKSELAESEAETSSVFENELYFLIRNKTGIELNIKKRTSNRWYSTYIQRSCKPTQRTWSLGCCCQ